MRYLTLLSTQSGSSNRFIVMTSNQTCPCTLYWTQWQHHQLCKPLKMICFCSEETNRISPFFLSWFLAMQCPKERKLNSLQAPYQGVVRFYQAPPPSPPLLLHILNLLCRTDFICEGLLCANVWNGSCTGLCTTDSWASWKIYFFSKIVVHLLT